MWLQWLIIAGILLLGEMFTPGFILFWFGIGALISMFASLVGAPLYVQVIIFIIISTVLLIFTRPIMKKVLKQKDIPSNVFTMAGKRGIVIQKINNMVGEGQVKIGGEVWRAEANDGAEIEVGTEVKVLKVEGVRVIVSSTQKNKSEEGEEK